MPPILARLTVAALITMAACVPYNITAAYFKPVPTGTQVVGKSAGSAVTKTVMAWSQNQISVEAEPSASDPKYDGLAGGTRIRIRVHAPQSQEIAFNAGQVRLQTANGRVAARRIKGNPPARANGRSVPMQYVFYTLDYPLPYGQSGTLQIVFGKGAVRVDGGEVAVPPMRFDFVTETLRGIAAING